MERPGFPEKVVDYLGVPVENYWKRRKSERGSRGEVRECGFWLAWSYSLGSLYFG